MPKPELPIPVEQLRQAHERKLERQSKNVRQYARQSAQFRAPLAEWEYKLAEWYTAERARGKQKIRHEILATHARVFQTETRAKDWPIERVFTKADWDNLNRRADWEDYVSLLNTSIREAARKKLADHSVKFVDSHVKGLEMAEAKKDYKQIYKYTVPMLERIDPVKTTQQVTAVQVILTPAQQQGLDVELPAVEAEIIPD